MKKINKSIRILFFVSLALSIALPVGIVGIVFGAIKKQVFLLVVGILLTVAGFYVMPILWVKYAERRSDRSLLFMIEREYIYTVSGLATQTGHTEQAVREQIKRMIRRHFLVGYLFRDDVLERNTNEKQTDEGRLTKLCDQCGGLMVFDGLNFRCEYCRTVEKGRK